MNWTVSAKLLLPHALASQVSKSNPLRFLFVKVVKGPVYVFSLPKNVGELMARITEAIAAIDNAMLKCIWQELDHRLDVYRVTNGANREHR